VSSTLTASLHSYLAADATLLAAAVGGIWVDPAPEGVAQPFVVVEQTLASDAGYGGGGRYSTVTYEVSAVAPASQVAAVRTAAGRLDALLHDARPTLTGFRVLGCRRTAPVDMVMEETTGRWVQVGGEYTVMVESA